MLIHSVLWKRSEEQNKEKKWIKEWKNEILICMKNNNSFFYLGVLFSGVSPPIFSMIYVCVHLFLNRSSAVIIVIENFGQCAHKWSCARTRNSYSYPHSNIYENKSVLFLIRPLFFRAKPNSPYLNGISTNSLFEFVSSNMRSIWINTFFSNLHPLSS